MALRYADCGGCVWRGASSACRKDSVHMPMWGYSYSAGFGGWAMGALLLACLVAFGLVIWALLSVAERREHRADPLAPGALETLRRRYALGEIDEPTFLRM